MGKYEKLGNFLREQKASIVPLRFREIEKIVGSPLPSSARYAAWWSNNPWNNVMTKVWLAAGFKSEQVDIKGEKLVFRRDVSDEPAQALKESSSPYRAAIDEPHGRRKEMARVMDEQAPSQTTPSELAEKFIYPPGTKIHPLYGALKGTVRIMPGTDLTEPADPDWGKVYED